MGTIIFCITLTCFVYLRIVNPIINIQKMMDGNVIQVQQSRYMGRDVNVIVPVFKTPERVVIKFGSLVNPTG